MTYNSLPYVLHILLHADVPIAADHSLFPKRLRKTIARHRTAVVTSSQRGDFLCLGDGFVLAHQWSMNGAPYYGQSAVAKESDKGAGNSPLRTPSSIFEHHVGSIRPTRKQQSPHVPRPDSAKVCATTHLIRKTFGIASVPISGTDTNRML
ncbi:hypothetical protein CDAR_94931 [Caerostris darwini]|uniref:Uncharacterized protein n=1 Tax=Caerostris darwini TaxID=1538125 RepID=A0AAV4PKR1_9ARAC|nr:hypothetical protein CDAR_94931 [Caerostris darwini]